MYVERLSCGQYELVAQGKESLWEEPDGSIEISAERRYLVRLGAGADCDVLAGALSIPHQGTEGVLQFGNFIGVAELGGRRLRVVSDRVPASAVARMLDDVSLELASLPFGAATPTAAPYARARELAPDALYHAFAVLRDAMRARGPHDLRGAVERILARPYESLRADEPRLVPLAQVSNVDAHTLSSIQSAPELLATVTAGSLRSSRLAKSLDGRMPGMVRVAPLAHDNDTAENRFVVAALEAMADLVRRFERFSRASGQSSSAINAQEAAEIGDQLQRWRRHNVIERLPPGRSFPFQSTVLRGRPGYRELLSIYLDLLARTHMALPHDLRPLLELRDAALIYEYWCFFRVVAAASETLGSAPSISRFSVTELGSKVPYGYRAQWPGLEIVYNETFSPDAAGAGKRGKNSYSVRLRPDITVRTAGGHLHVLDAKLKLNLSEAFQDADEEHDETRADTFKRADLYKMHAYRDALGADSVWILYPGSGERTESYAFPWSEPGISVFQGVGAVPLRPDSQGDGGLGALIRDLLVQDELAD